MDFEKLIGPYRENGRTTEGQRRWLLKKGISPDIVDQAILFVYDKVEEGMKFVDGHAFDVYLYQIAKTKMIEEDSLAIKNLELLYQSLKEKWLVEYKKTHPELGFFGRVKKVFKP